MTTEYPINIGQVVLHKESKTLAKVIRTHFLNGERTMLQEIEQEVALRDGSRRRDKFVELTLASPEEARSFTAAP